MHKLLSFLFVPVVPLLLLSCKKERETEAPAPATITDFARLEVGNYWVYEIVDLDPLGTPVSTWPELDSMVVIGDTVLDGTPYSVIADHYGQDAPGFQYLRIEGDRILSPYEIIFQYGGFGTVIRRDSIQGVSHTAYTVDPNPVSITVPAGTFSAYAMIGHVTPIGQTGIPADHFPAYHWAPGVGMVRFRAYDHTTGMGRDVRLVRYR